MSNELHNFAKQTVWFAHLMQAFFYGGFGLLWVALIAWITLTFGENWIVLAIDAFLLCCAVPCFFKAFEIYAASKPAERFDDRQRHFEARGLYVTRPRERRQREGKESHR
jgi:hypothetical protein